MDTKDVKIYDVPSRRCDNGESVFDVLDQMKSDGIVPQNASIGHSVTTQGGYRGSGECVGIIQVRSNEYFWVEVSAK